MADSNDLEPDENPTGFLNAVAILCLLLTVGGLVWVITSMPEIPDVNDDSFSLAPPEVDTERLDQERAEKYGSPDLEKGAEEIDELLETVKDANLMQFGSPGQKEIHDAQILTMHHANNVLTAVGTEAYMKAGERMFEGCKNGFQELLDALKSGGILPEQARQDPGEKFDAYRKWCGKGYPAMEEFGIVNPDGTWRQPKLGPIVFDIMNRFRWGAVLDLRKPPWEQLTPYEYEILTRWRASLDSIPTEKRVSWVLQASRDLPKLDHHQLIGNLHYQAGDYIAALREYEEACKKDRQDAYLKKKCDYLDQKVSGGAAAGGASGG